MYRKIRDGILLGWLNYRNFEIVISDFWVVNQVIGPAHQSYK